jgi:CRISPR-associated protein Cas1
MSVMGTLYLDRQDLEVRQESDYLCLYEGGERRGTVPLTVVDRVVIRGRATVSTGALGLLAERGVGLLVLGGRHGRRVAMLLGRPHGDVARRVAQYRWHSEAGRRLPLARLVVLGKLRGQCQLLRRAMERRPDRRKPLFDALAQVEVVRERIRGADPGQISLSSLRGMEGAAAAAYFAGFTALFAPSLAFTGRNRRPPRDPVNATLSLAYTLLHFEAVMACHMTGLDPFVGVYHDLAYNRESLGADLVEPLRPCADEWVWRLFAERRLHERCFVREGEACLLNKQGREVFYRSFEAFCRGIRRRLRRYAGILVRTLAGDTDP